MKQLTEKQAWKHLMEYAYSLNPSEKYLCVELGFLLRSGRIDADTAMYMDRYIYSILRGRHTFGNYCDYPNDINEIRGDFCHLMSLSCENENNA